MRIAVDLDDTIANLLNNLLLFHNEIYGTQLERADFFSYHYEKVWGGSKEEAVKKVRQFIDSKYFLNILPLEGAYESLSLLKKQGHELFIVTGREHSTEEITRAWIEQNFPNIFSGIYHTNAYSGQGIRLKKSEVCLKLETPLIIDDDVMHIMDCFEAGISVIIFDNPWNQGEFPNNVNRVCKWEEIPQLINELIL